MNNLFIGIEMAQLFGYIYNAKLLHLGLQDLNIGGQDDVGGLIC